MMLLMICWRINWLKFRAISAEKKQKVQYVNKCNYFIWYFHIIHRKWRLNGKLNILCKDTFVNGKRLTKVSRKQKSTVFYCLYIHKRVLIISVDVWTFFRIMCLQLSTILHCNKIGNRMTLDLELVHFAYQRFYVNRR